MMAVAITTKLGRTALVAWWPPWWPRKEFGDAIWGNHAGRQIACSDTASWWPSTIMMIMITGKWSWCIRWWRDHDGLAVIQLCSLWWLGCWRRWWLGWWRGRWRHFLRANKGESVVFSDKSTAGHIACQIQTVPCHEIRPLLLPTYHRFPHFAINQRPHPLSSYLHCAIKYCEEESGGQKVKATIFTSKSWCLGSLRTSSICLQTAPKLTRGPNLITLDSLSLLSQVSKMCPTFDTESCYRDAHPRRWVEQGDTVSLDCTCR